MTHKEHTDILKQRVEEMERMRRGGWLYQLSLEKILKPYQDLYNATIYQLGYEYEKQKKEHFKENIKEFEQWI